MDILRHIRIAEISRYDINYANESLVWMKEKLEQLKNTKYEGNIPNELFYNIHLTADDIYLTEKRIGELLDMQLDEYHVASSPTYSWDKKEACRLLKEATQKGSVMIPLGKIVNLVHASLWRISRDEKLDALNNLCVILGIERYISFEHAKELMEQYAVYE